MTLDPQSLEFCRTLLFVPVLEQRFVDKAHQRGAGGIILDLEDAVAPAYKLQARQKVVAVASQLRARGVTVLVRVNHGSADDMAAAVSADVSALVLPKVESAAEIREADAILTARESQLGLAVGQTRLLVLIETPLAVCNALDIAIAHPRISGLILGSEDLAWGLHTAPSIESLRYAASQVILAARAAGKVPLGIPGSLATIKKSRDYVDAVDLGRRMGMAGAVCIHPDQVAVVQGLFELPAEEVLKAQAVLDAFDAAERSGKGAVMHDGKMLDLPVVEQARKIVIEARMRARQTEPKHGAV